MSSRRTGLREGGLVVLATVVVGVGAGVAIHALNGGRGSSARDNPPGLHGQATWNPGERPAPDFRLPDQSGRQISLGSLRGHTLMLAFFSSGCHRACAPEARSLHTALRLLPPPARPVLVIVSRDPSHDTPQSTRAAVARWGLGSAAAWHWLLGSRDQLAPVLTAYRADDRGAGASAIAPVYLIDRAGFERAGLLYPFPPGWPAGDLRILAAED